LIIGCCLNNSFAVHPVFASIDVSGLGSTFSGAFCRDPLGMWDSY
jgi:hypothetical protein